MSWLISNALIKAYESSRYSQEPAEASLAAICLDGVQSAQLNVMPTPHKFWRNDKTMEPYQLSRFGLTCAVLTEDLGKGLLTWFQEDFLARTSAPQGMERGSKENDLASGVKWLESSVRYDLDSSSWKTHLSLWEEVLPWSSVILPKWGMTRSGALFQHPTAERPINVTVSGLWPTPSGVTSGKNHVVGRLDEWGGSGNRFRGTPIASVRCASFEEWMMGWPMGWSALTPLEMDKFREWQQQHSIF